VPDRLVFEPEEIVLAGKVLSFLNEDGSSQCWASAEHIRTVMDQLVHLRQVVTSYTSVIQSHTVAGQQRDVHTLTDAICRSNPYTFELFMPTRAVVGRAYLVAKFNFMRLLVRIVRHQMSEGERKLTLLGEMLHFVRQSVITMIAEDVLVSIASDPGLELELRRKATYKLADLWEHRTSRSVRDFFPLLLSVWEAKTRTTISYGTLTGTTEILSLMREGCDPAVIEYFTGEDIPEDERQAWMELVFNATYEEMETMRRYMERHRKQVLGAEDVAAIFNVPMDSLHRTVQAPVDMFHTFHERQVNAYHRRMQNRPGPKKTAEEYLMIFHLEQTDIQVPEVMPATRLAPDTAKL